MLWNSESKKAFVQALNTTFLITIHCYTNFQFAEAKHGRSRDQIYIRFSDSEKKRCKKYLEQVTAAYKNTVISPQKSVFDFNSFPFCIKPGQFSTSVKNGVKFKVSLDQKVIDNLYYVFINQFLSFEIESLPNKLELDDYDRNNAKYIVGWTFSQKPGNPDLEKEEKTRTLLKKYNFSVKEENIVRSSDGTKDKYMFIHQCKANEAVQKAIEHFPTKLLGKYPKSLLMLFYIFYSYKAELCGLEKNIKTAKADGNVVSFYCCAKDTDKVRNYKKMIDEDKSSENFKDFINFSKEDKNTFKVSFNFDFHNVSVILAKVPCNIDHVRAAHEFAYVESVVGAVSTTSVGSGSVSRVDAAPSSSKQPYYLQVPTASSSHKSSTEHSDDSVLGESPGASFESPPDAPTASATCSGVIKKSKSTGNSDNSEPKPNMAGSEFIRNSDRSKGVPLSKPDNVLGATKIRKISGTSSDISQVGIAK